MKKYLLIALVLLVKGNTYSQNFDVNPKWQFGSYGHDIGVYLMDVIDLNNDNSNELIISSNISDSWDQQDYFYILKYSDVTESYQFHWISRIFNAKITATLFKDLNDDQFQDIIIGLSNGNIHIFDGKSLKEIKAFNTRRKTINSLVIIDVDNDNQDEVIICDSDSSSIYSPSFELEAEIPYGGNKMTIGNVDNDEEVEIILSSGKVIEVQGGNYTIEKEFNSYDNTQIFTLHDVDGDDRLELIYNSNYSELTCHDFSSNNPMWTVNSSSSIESITIYSNPINNRDEIYLGTTYNGINIYNAINGNFVNKMPDHHEGVNNIAIGDVDNDGEIELIWADGANCTCEDYIFIHKLDNLSEEWRNFPLNGPFTALDHGDVDNDGDNEIVIISESSGSHEGGVINVFNSNDGSLEWRSKPFRDDISSVKISDTDGDNNYELLVGIEYTGLVVPATYLYIFETNTYEIDTAILLYDSRRIRDIKVADINNDSINEIILSTGSGWSSDRSHIFVLSGESRELLWQSEEFGRNLNYTYSLNISNIDDDDALEIIGIDYTFRSDSKGDIFIIDGMDYSIQKESQFSYTCLTSGDYNKDGQLEIMAGTDYGEIVILNGLNLEPIIYINTDSTKISAIEMFNDGDNNPSILYSNGIQLIQLGDNETENLFVSDSMYSSVGDFNSLLILNMDNANPEVFVGSNHSALQFSLSNTEIFINDYPWDGEILTAIDDIGQQEKTVNAYPNPFGQDLTFSFHSQSQIDTKIELYNIYGELVHVNKHASVIGQNKPSLSTDFLPQGIYIYRLIQANIVVATGKIIKV